MSGKPSLYVISTASYCGKSALCLGLALKFKENGYKVGYFKPVGWEMTRGPKGERIDEDAQLLVKVLGLQLPLETISPLILGTRFLEESAEIDPVVYEKRILEAYEKASRNMDLMLIEGPYNLGIGTSFGLDPATISKRLGSALILVSQIENDSSVDQIIWAKRALDAAQSHLMGVILCRVPKTDVERVRNFAVAALKRNGIHVLGIVPDNVALRAPTVRELCDKTHCTILTGEENLDNLVEDFLVGAMTPESALSYFRRSMRKAVITGGDRTDIQLVALQTDVSALVLTGNYYPDVRVLSRAEELGVPVLLVPTDTYTTVMGIANLTGRIKPSDTKKIEAALQCVGEHVDWETILHKLVPKGE